MVRRTKADAQITRNQILDAAEQVFQDRGVARTSLQDVAAAAGVTRGAIYWHFKDKAELFSAMMERVTLPWETPLEMPWAVAMGLRAGDTISELRGMILMPLHAVVHDEHGRRVFTIAMHATEYNAEDMAPVRERKEASLNAFLDRLEATLQRGMAKGQIKTPLDTRTIALGLLALMDGLLRQWTRNPAAFALIEVGDASVQQFLSGLALPATAAPSSAPAPALPQNPAAPPAST
ncbi:TetR family transcriptional regulator [Ideonella azotifigens]|uniref:TetR family transcriptional regulator n=1 Tax=Ideonella azotifigens TaxID=513160 RepID=A0ABN1KMR7_9BURK|nr:TetR family transcriptional regulator [Ideonella azotifigens]MCD2343422.1 TetR family transcriptional regulator [Ideonella azotifigens]